MPTATDAELVDLLTAGTLTPVGRLVVLAGGTPQGEPVVAPHSPEPALRTVAVLDAVLNNSDRKGSHLMREGSIVRGCDHGVSLGVEPKLRTVLWGWAGDQIPDTDLARLDALARALDGSLATDLAPLLTAVEVAALKARVRTLLATRRHPLPTPGWPAIPWPAL